MGQPAYFYQKKISINLLICSPLDQSFYFELSVVGIGECSGLVSRVLDLRIEGCHVHDLLESLFCDWEQHTLSSALYWFNPGRPVSLRCDP